MKVEKLTIEQRVNLLSKVKRDFLRTVSKSYLVSYLNMLDNGCKGYSNVELIKLTEENIIKNNLKFKKQSDKNLKQNLCDKLKCN